MKILGASIAVMLLLGLTLYSPEALLRTYAFASDSEYTKPWLEISPPLKVLGEPVGKPMVGTPKAFFSIDIMIKNVTSEMNLIGVQPSLRITPQFRLVNVTEGTFMNNPLWAPYGAALFFFIDYDYPPGFDTISLGCIINLNPSTFQWDWPERPSGDGLFCTLHFEVLYQEEYPWESHTTIDLEPLFPGDMFMDSTLEWIPYSEPHDGEIVIKGYNPLVGDMNGDFKVDVKDLILFVKAFGSHPTHLRWNLEADLNNDSKVDIKDLVLLIKNFGKTYP